MAKDTEKLIRQLSLISYLMAERRPVTATEIRRDVEGYSDMTEDAFARLDACGADPELVALCKRCLAADRESRPRDAGEVAEAMTAHLAAAEERIFTEAAKAWGISPSAMSYAIRAPEETLGVRLLSRMTRSVAPRSVFGTRVNGLISTIAATSSGACAAAMVAAPPDRDCPTMTAGPRRWPIST